jgi:hypothetical protein
LSYFQWNPPTSPRAQGRVGESQPPDELVVVDQAIAVQVGLVDHLVHLLGAWLAMGALRVETSQRELGKSWENHGKIMGRDSTKGINTNHRSMYVELLRI